MSSPDTAEVRVGAVDVDRTDAGAHIERPTRLAGGKTYCSCGRPWPCPFSATCGICGASSWGEPCKPGCTCDDCQAGV